MDFSGMKKKSAPQVTRAAVKGAASQANFLWELHLTWDSTPGPYLCYSVTTTVPVLPP